MDEQIDGGESGWIDGWRGKQMKDELDGQIVGWLDD